jgi:hypothetical protein
VDNVELSPSYYTLATFDAGTPFAYAADILGLPCAIQAISAQVWRAWPSGPADGGDTGVSYPLSKLSTVVAGERWGVTGTLAAWASLPADNYDIVLATQTTCDAGYQLPGVDSITVYP